MRIMVFDSDLLVALLPELKRFALYLTRNDIDAADLVQDTYVKLLESGHLCDGRKPAAWAIQTMKNAWTDQIRYRSYRNHQPIDDAIGAASNDPGADTRLYAKEVISIIDGMRPIYRETLIAHVLCESFGGTEVYEGKRRIRTNHATDDHKLVGEMVGIDRLITINQRIFRARKELTQAVA